MNVDVVITTFQVKGNHKATFVKICQSSFPVFVFNVLFSYIIVYMPQIQNKRNFPEGWTKTDNDARRVAYYLF